MKRTERAESIYRSRLSAAIHETAAGLHRAGLLDKATMREFDESCLTPIADFSRGISPHFASERGSVRACLRDT